MSLRKFSDFILTSTREIFSVNFWAVQLQLSMCILKRNHSWCFNLSS